MYKDNCINVSPDVRRSHFLPFKRSRKLLNRCIPEKSAKVADTFFSKLGWSNFFQEAAEDLFLTWREIVLMCTVSCVLTYILVVLLRFFVGVLIWIVLIGVSLASLAGTIFLWILYKQTLGTTTHDSILESRKSWSFLCFAVLATILTMCLVLIIIVLRKRIQLVVQLFVEAGKAVASMPLLLVQPILTFVCLVSAVACWVFFSIWIQSAGKLTYIREDFFTFEPDAIIKVARWWNFFAMLWMVQFIVGCQHMIIAGAVAIWYFSRDKKDLGNPILYSTYNLTKYHLGSVCLGSLLIAIIQLLRVLLTLLQKSLEIKQGKCAKYILACCHCCLYCLERVLKYITRNAYIEIAMYGYNFCQGGKQAFKLLAANSLRLLVINSVGDFVLFLGKVLVVIATVLVGIEIIEGKEGLQHVWIPLVLGGLFSYFIAHCFLTIYEMIIDTIFLCFCEDCQQNDGISRPYYMSRGLMEFVENSKKALNHLDKTTGGATLTSVTGNL